MAGRGGGRGRGRGTPFDLGFGDVNSAPTVVPPPKYPELKFGPSPPEDTVEKQDLLSYKQFLTRSMRTMPYYLQMETATSAIVRYSDKYRKEAPSVAPDLDWRLIPNELRPKEFQIKKQRSRAVKKRKIDMSVVVDEAKIIASLEKKAIDDQEESDKEDKGDKADKKKDLDEDENEDKDSEEEVDEDDQVESNDYCMSYFDNGEGEGDGDEEDDLEEGDVF